MPLDEEIILYVPLKEESFRAIEMFNLSETKYTLKIQKNLTHPRVKFKRYNFYGKEEIEQFLGEFWEGGWPDAKNDFCAGQIIAGRDVNHSWPTWMQNLRESRPHGTA